MKKTINILELVQNIIGVKLSYLVEPMVQEQLIFPPLTAEQQAAKKAAKKAKKTVSQITETVTKPVPIPYRDGE